MNPVSPSFGSVTLINTSNASGIDRVQICPDEDQGNFYYVNRRGRRQMWSDRAATTHIEQLVADEDAGPIGDEKRQALVKFFEGLSSTNLGLRQFRQILIEPFRQGGASTSSPIDVVRV